MPDTYLSGGSSKSATRSHLDAEKADMRPLLILAAVQGQYLVGVLQEMAEQRIYRDERQKGIKGALGVCGALIDALDDLVGPTLKRADEAGLNRDDYTFDTSDLDALHAKLEAMLP